MDGGCLQMAAVAIRSQPTTAPPLAGSCKRGLQDRRGPQAPGPLVLVFDPSGRPASGAPREGVSHAAEQGRLAGCGILEE